MYVRKSCLSKTLHSEKWDQLYISVFSFTGNKHMERLMQSEENMPAHAETHVCAQILMHIN